MPEAAVTIVDAGIGNVRSVLRMFEEVDVDAAIVAEPSRLERAQRVVLPGVGAFDAGMAALDRGGWRDALDHHALVARRPILGVCLGMQLLCRGSEEGQSAGLGWIAADVRIIDTGGDPRLKIPHMGWSAVRPLQDNPLIALEDGELSRFYHVHKYRAVCDDPAIAIGEAVYGTPFTTAVQRDNILGVQFHPEKSHRHGMQLLRRFAALS